MGGSIGRNATIQRQRLIASKRLFTVHTRNYLRRRAWRYFRNLGTSQPDRYGAAALQAAIGEALQRDVPHPNAVRLALERAREEQGLPPPTTLCLSEEVARRDAPVRSHELASYDRIVQAAQPSEENADE